MTAATSAPLTVFISYSHKDEALREELDVHLSNLKRQNKIAAWHDRAIEAGSEWDAAIKHQLETAEIILLLISPRFMASDYCYDLEMQQAIERHNQGSARVIPIILKPVDWSNTPFSKLQVLPKDAKPITQWADPDEAFLDVVKGIRRAAESLQAKKTPGAAPANSAASVAPASVPHFSTYNPKTWAGRTEAIAHLSNLPDSRLLIIHGMTGIGKTALAERLAADLVGPNRYVQVVLDRGVSSPDFTRGALAILGAMGDDTAQQLPDDQILPYLLKTLLHNSCWLQLDSLEFLLHQTNDGEFQFIDRAWVDFFCQFLAAPTSPIRLVLTSQAVPLDLLEQCDRHTGWHDYSLRGLEETSWLELFRNYGVVPQNSTEETHLCAIAHHFDGHPLILKMIAGDIGKALFGGSVTKYWREYYSRQTRPKLHQSQEQRARNWVNQTLQQLPGLSWQLLQRCAVFRRAVPESFYLQMLPETDCTAALLTLKSRYLVEEADIQAGQIFVRQHNLIRDAAGAALKTDRSTWETAHRQAAHLWLTAYQPAPDAENLETVRGYLEAFDHYCEVEDWEQAGKIYMQKLETTNQALHWQLFIWGNYQELIQNSVRLAKEVSSNVKIRCLLSLGNSNVCLGNQHKAIEWYENALTAAQEIGDRQGEGAALGNLGIVYERLGEYGQAIYFHQQRLTIAREIDDRQGEGTTLGNLGNAYYRLGEYGQSLNYYQQHLTIAREIGDRQGESIALCNLGETQIKLEQFPKALGNSQTALEICREIGDRLIEAEVLKNLAVLHQQLGERNVALEYCQQALALATELGIPLVKECKQLQLELQNKEFKVEDEN